MKEPKFELQIVNRPVVLLDGKEHPTLEDAKCHALALILNSEPEMEGVKLLVKHAAQVVKILQWTPDAAPAKAAKKAFAYTDAEYEEAAKETGFPIGILRQRVVTLGWSLPKARTVPYVPRKRKPSTEAVNAATEAKV